MSPPRVKIQQDRTQSAHVPAPVLGMDTVSAGTSMPDGYSIYSYNLIGAEYGLRSRLGWREYAVGIGEQIRSLMPFTGSTASGSNDRLFCATESGIWNVTGGGAVFGPSALAADYVAGGGTLGAATYYFCVVAIFGSVYSRLSNIVAGVAPAGTAAFNITWEPVPGVTGYYVYVKAGGAPPAVSGDWAVGHKSAGPDETSLLWSDSTINIFAPSRPPYSGPEQLLSFGTAGSDAGWGISTVFVNSAGTHYLAYCDEANGYHLYSEASGTWTKILAAATNAWTNATLYGAGATVTSGGLSYVTVAGGTSNGTNPLDDVGVTWVYYPSIGGVDPADLAFVMGWKNRLWFVEKDTASGWYLDIGAVTGTAVKFNFGARFKAGGDLRGLWSWTYDGGSGIDDALVAVSGGGDVVVYKGTDPSDAATFALSGVWYAGSVPAGRKLCTDFGGDLLFMSSTGVQSMSKLVSGGSPFSTQYETARIANLFAQLQASSRNLRGWSMRIHPQDSALMVLAPVAEGVASTQLVMSLTTKGWHQYRDIPMGICAESWGGTLYFGTEDGRICSNDGYVDGVLLSDPNAYTPISFSLLTGFNNLGRPTQKQVHFIRPTVMSQGSSVPLQAAARFRWDLTEIPTLAAAVSSGGSLWNSAVWDQSVWGGAYSPQQSIYGGSGIGPEVAVAIRGSASARMTLTGFDINFEEGGFL